jgi:uncharacterized membrane protein YgcG
MSNSDSSRRDLRFRWPRSSGLRLTAPARAKDERPAAARSAAGDRLRLSETTPNTFKLERGLETIGTVKLVKSRITIALGPRTATVEEDGGDLVLTTDDGEELVRAKPPRRRQGTRLMLRNDADELAFDRDHERLTTSEDDALLLTLTPRRTGRTRIVVVQVEQPLDDDLTLAFAATITLLRRLSPAPTKRWGMDGGRATDGTITYGAGLFAPSTGGGGGGGEGGGGAGGGDGGGGG